MPPAPLAAGALAVFGLALTIALAFGTRLGLTWRLAAVALLGACLGPPLAELAGGRARRTVGLDGAGRWWLQQGTRAPDYVQIVGRALIVGPWVWIRLRGGSVTHYVCVEGRRAEPEAFRRLKVVLLLDPEGGRGRASDHDRLNC